MIRNFEIKDIDLDIICTSKKILLCNLITLDLQNKQKVNRFVSQFSTYFYKLEDIEFIKNYFLDKEYYNMIYIMDLLICEKNLNFVKYEILKY